MSENLQINGTSFLPVKECASRFHYTRDYVSRLAREGKVVAMRVGKQWLIDPVSLEHFAHTADLEHKARQHHLSLERRRERLVKEAVEASLESLRVADHTHRARARRVAVAVFIFCVFAGYSLYLAPFTAIPSALQIATAPRVVDEKPVALSGEESNQPLSLGVTLMERPVFADSFTVEAFASTTGVLLLPQGTSTHEGGVDPREFFSDEVVVTMQGEGVGTVRLKDGVQTDGVIVEVPFVTVPIRSVAEEEVEPNTRL